MGKWADVGYTHLYEMGTERNTDKALECFRKGTKAGDMQACFAIYETWGDGVSLISEDEAMEMLKKAASLGHEKAAYLLKQNEDKEMQKHD